MELLSPDHAIVLVERTFVVVLRRPPTPSLVATLEARVRAAVRIHSPPLGYLHVVLDVPTTGKVDDDSRTALISFAKRTMHLSDCAAMVLMRSGFAGAAMRAVVTGALMAIRPNVPVRVFSEIDPATQFLSQNAPTEKPRDPAKVLRAANELRAHLLQDFAPEG
ncbi:MAG: hypothetical protein JNK05_35825 [Myxococcales bacterium]|nr:hypothetical protein [Myxococcales bacterium]